MTEGGEGGGWGAGSWDGREADVSPTQMPKRSRTSLPHPTLPHPTATYQLQPGTVKTVKLQLPKAERGAVQTGGLVLVKAKASPSDSKELVRDDILVVMGSAELLLVGSWEF